ncbi:class I SAM-dependent methyltransferase [Gimesia sp.]|uniref:class I SAM-dependent methyltransferase n=1 Tax=Gimesia sp. TaxID=2024833 RepID=UPI003A9386FF
MLNPMYGRHAAEYAAAIRDNSYNAHYERPSLIALLPELQGKRVIDLGCGPGEYAAYLTSQGATVTAVDSSLEMISLVQQKLGNSVHAYAQDLTKGVPDEADRSFDLAVSPLMIHYLEDPTPLFRDVKRILKPEGQFVFSTHHPFVDYQFSPSGNYFLTEKIIDEWDTLGRPTRVEYFRRPLSALMQSLTDAGLYVVELSEGRPDKQMQESDPESYRKLSTAPGFLFLKCRVM